MLIKNTFFLFLLQGVNYIIPIFLIPFFSNTLGFKGYGNIALCLSIIQFSYIVTDFGFMTYATKEIVSFNRDKYLISKFVSSVYYIKAVILFILIIPIVFYCSVKGYSFSTTFFVFLTIIAQAYQPIWFFHGLEKMKSVTFYFSTTKLLYLFLVISCVDQNKSWTLVIIFWCFSQLLACLISNFQYIYAGYFFCRVSVFDIISIFKKSVHFFLSRISVACYTSLNLIILGFVSLDGSSLASFAICDQIFKAGQSFTSPITQALYPYLQRTKNWKVFIRATISSLFILTTALVFFHYNYGIIFNYIFHNSPQDINKILDLFLILIIINFLARNLGNPIFGPLNKMKIANNTVIFGGVFHLIVISFLYVSNILDVYSMVYCLLATESMILFIRILFLLKIKLTLK